MLNAIVHFMQYAHKPTQHYNYYLGNDFLNIYIETPATPFMSNSQLLDNICKNTISNMPHS